MNEEKKEKDGSQKDEAVRKECRLVVSADAETAVSEFMDAVNDGFEAGRASRFDIASYMIIWAKNHVPDDAILDIRRRLADDLSMLDAITKKAKVSGDVPEELRIALEKHFFGAAGASVKKQKKGLKHEYITDIPNDQEAA